MKCIYKSAIAASTLALLFSGAAHGAEYIINGTFNDNASNVTSSQTGWTVSPTSIYFFDHLYHVGSSNQSSLSQDVSGAIGAAVLAFDYSAGGNTGDGGYESAVWNGTILNTIAGPSGIQHYSFNITATGTDTLTFLGENPGSYNVLSNVSLTLAPAVPEPETYAMLLAGLALLGVIARRKAGPDGEQA